MYPTKIEANGHYYKLNTDYRIALACLKAVNDKSINELERFYAIEGLLIDEDNIIMQDEKIIQEKMAIYLRCGAKENTPSEEIDMDYFKDEVRIKTSIRQCYHINLNEIPYMHWYEYNELISGLTSESLLNKTRELRNLKLSDIKDPIEREKLRKAQEYVSLEEYKEREYTEQEKRSIEQFYKDIGR